MREIRSWSNIAHRLLRDSCRGLKLGIYSWRVLLGWQLARHLHSRDDEGRLAADAELPAGIALPGPVLPQRTTSRASANGNRGIPPAQRMWSNADGRIFRCAGELPLLLRV